MKGEEGADTKCWICGGYARTGEHKSKKSDIKAVLGSPSPTAPLFIHTSDRVNRRLMGLKADILKSKGLICGFCNNELTQPYDVAWSTLSDALRARRPSLIPGDRYRATTAFPYDTGRHLLRVHLFFVKLFGCHIAETGVNIDLTEFSASILQGRAHPHVYLQVGRAPSLAGNQTVGMSNLCAAMDSAGRCGFAVWDYYVGPVAVTVIFAPNGGPPPMAGQAWHPQNGTSRFKVIDTGILRGKISDGVMVGFERVIRSKKAPEPIE